MMGYALYCLRSVWRRVVLWWRRRTCDVCPMFARCVGEWERMGQRLQLWCRGCGREW